MGFTIIFLLICDGTFKLSFLLLYTVVNKNKKCPTDCMRGQNARANLEASRPSDLITEPALSSFAGFQFWD
jgi:hypothetical protein